MTLLNNLKDLFNNKMVYKSINVLGLRVAGMLLFFGLTLFLTNNFEASWVGQYDFSRALLIFMGGVCVFGMHQSVIYYAGYLKARNSLAYLKKLYKKMVVIVFAIALIFFLAVLGISPDFIDRLFEKEVSQLVTYSVFALFFYGITLLNIDVFRAINKIYISEFYRNIMRYAIFFAAIIFLYLTENPQFLVEVFLLNFAFLALLSTAFLMYYFSKVNAKNASEEITYKQIIKRSGPMAISAITYLLMQSVDVILLSKYSSFERVAFYSVAIKLTTVLSLVLASVNTVYAPSFAEWYSMNDFKSLREGLKRSTRLIFLFTFPVIIIILIFSKMILGFFGPNYVEARWALIVLLIGQAVNAFCGSVGVYMNMTGKQVIFQRILIIAFTINIVLNLILIPKYDLLGAAIATTISTVFWNLVTTAYIYRKDKIITFLTIK
jgi:O-antigen/teichoic acid export membrane protein